MRKKIFIILFVFYLSSWFPLVSFAQSSDLRIDQWNTSLKSHYNNCAFEEIFRFCDSLEQKGIKHRGQLGCIALWRGKAQSQTLQRQEALSSMQKAKSLLDSAGDGFEDYFAMATILESHLLYDQSDHLGAKKILWNLLKRQQLSVTSRVEATCVMAYQLAARREMYLADSLLMNANQLIGHEVDSFSLEAGLLYHRMGHVYLMRWKHSEGKKYAELAFKILTNHAKASPVNKINVHVLLAQALASSDFQKTIWLQEKALNEAHCHGKSTVLSRAMIHYNLADAYFVKSNYALAESNYWQSIELLDQINMTGHLRQWLSYVYLTQHYARINDTIRTKELAKMSFDMAKKYGHDNSSRLMTVRSSLAQVESDIDRKIDLLLDNYNYVKKKNGSSHFATLQNAAELAVAYVQSGDVEKSRYYFNISKSAKHYRRAHNAIPNLYEDFASSAIRSNNYKLAKIYIDSTISYIEKQGGINKNLFERISKIPGVHFQKALLDRNRWRTNQDTNALYDAHANFSKALRSIEYVLPIINSNDEKQKLITALQNYYKYTLENALLIFDELNPRNWQEVIYSLVTESKNVVTQLNYQDAQLKVKFEMPDSIKRKYALLNRRLILLQRDKTNAHETVAKRRFDESIDSVQVKINQQRVDWERQNPMMAATKIRSGALSLVDVQKELEASECLVEYFQSGHRLFAFLIKKDQYSLLSLGQYAPIRKRIRAYVKMLRKKPSLEGFASGQTTQDSISKVLFDDLLAPILDSLKSTNNMSNLIFLADGEINYIPLEALKMSNDSFFLQSPYCVSYGLNNDIFSSLKSSYKEEELAYFEPSYDPATIRYIDTISSTLLAEMIRTNSLAFPESDLKAKISNTSIPTTYFLKDQANKRNFLSLAAQFKILHLSMHAFIDEAYPMQSMLLFQNDEIGETESEKLFLGEIFQYPMQNELVFLEACQSGTGKIYGGEGVVSFARAFQAAGVRSTISGLWNLPHQTTSEITSSFYKYLANGSSKSLSMKQAKLDFLKTQNEDILKQPYYWAGLVLNGNPDAIKFEPKRNESRHLWILSGAVLMLFLWFYFSRRAKSF